MRIGRESMGMTFIGIPEYYVEVIRKKLREISHRNEWESHENSSLKTQNPGHFESIDLRRAST